MRKKSGIIANMVAAIMASAVLFSSCAVTNLLQKEKQATFDVNYEYAFRSDHKVEPLFNESVLFFDKEEYGLEYFIAGDLITVTHTGEIYILETYPSTVKFEKGEIKDVTCTRASVMEVECIENSENVSIVAEGYTFTEDSKVQYVITASDGSYDTLGEAYVGKKLFASYRPSEDQKGRRRLWALYTFNPSFL